MGLGLGLGLGLRVRVRVRVRVNKGRGGGGLGSGLAPALLAPSLGLYSLDFGGFMSLPVPVCLVLLYCVV